MRAVLVFAVKVLPSLDRGWDEAAMSDRPQPTMNRLEDKIAWYNPKSIASKKNYRLRQGAQLVAFEVSSVGVLTPLGMFHRVLASGSALI